MKLDKRNIVMFCYIIVVLCSIYLLRLLQVSDKLKHVEEGGEIRATARVYDVLYNKGTKDVIEVEGIKLEIEQYSGIEVGDLVNVTGTLEKRVIRENRMEYWLKNPDIMY